jgi:hypothetical protein
MARDFDNFPTYDPVGYEPYSKSKVYLSDVWSDFMATFVETLQGYLGQNGIQVPRLTTNERDALQNVVGGWLIYNTTLEKFQGYEGSPLAWVNLV